ncbi:SDR family NAD(P)-dependent oxidoreductase [Klebsiella pneumoniae]|nr:SDR family NAD(P)-dependent oxidoreductase [Klebsiella pneumoniae]
MFVTTLPSKRRSEGITAFSRIDVVINNAGYTVFSPTECIPIDEAIRLLDTNLIGSLRVIQSVLPKMREQRSGHIIQVSSIAGLCAFHGMRVCIRPVSGRLKECLRRLPTK